MLIHFLSPLLVTFGFFSAASLVTFGAAAS